MRHLALLLAVLAALFALPAAAQDFPALDKSPVVDAADLLDPAQEAALEQKLLDYDRRNGGRQFVVATIPDLQGYEISDYSYRLGREWGIGSAEEDDGILLVVAPNEKRMRIEVGYGLEGVIPDGLAYDYVEGMKPYFREGDYAGGIAWGADQIIRQVELPPEEAAQVAQSAEQQRENDGGFPIGTLIWFGFMFVFFILPMFRRGGRRRRGGVVGDIILWEAGKAVARGFDGGGGWGGGGSFGGGGGFSGGGGSFGGGGASGGW